MVSEMVLDPSRYVYSLNLGVRMGAKVEGDGIGLTTLKLLPMDLLYPDDVIRNTIGHVGLRIYVVNEVLFICHTLLTLHAYAIYKIYNIQIRYILYI